LVINRKEGDEMKHIFVAFFILLLLAGCASVPEEQPQKTQAPPEEAPPEEAPPEEQAPPPIQEQIEEPEKSPEVTASQEVDIEPEEEIVEMEPIPLSEEEKVEELLNKAKSEIKNYYYRYKNPAGRQYLMHVKENKIRIGTLSDYNKIYIDTKKKTAEEWCISHIKCGKETGKVADLDYFDAYIETPIDWIAKITEAKKIDEGAYYGQNAWKLSTNIGTVVIDSKFGFIYSIVQPEKSYLFTDAVFNNVKDSDVNVPEYLIG